ncbi:unnamed protein product [Phaeothamnion confervicola]
MWLGATFVLLAEAALLILGTLAATIWWARQRRKLTRLSAKSWKRRTLAEVRASATSAVMSAGVGRNARRGSDLLELTAAAKQLATYGCHLASLGEYMATLRPEVQEALTTEEAAAKLMQAAGPVRLLPLLLLVPQTLRHAPLSRKNSWLSVLTADVINPTLLSAIIAVGSSIAATRRLSSSQPAAMCPAAAATPAPAAAATAAAVPNALGPSAVSQVVTAAAAAAAVTGPLKPLLVGLLGDLPQPFVLSRDVPLVAERLLAAAAAATAGVRAPAGGAAAEAMTTPGAASPAVPSNGSATPATSVVGARESYADGYATVTATELAPSILPGLLLNYVGLRAKLTRAEEAANAVIAEVFNRLAGNILPTEIRLELFGAEGADSTGSAAEKKGGDAKPPPFCVRVSEASAEEHTALDTLLLALAAAGHRVEGSFESRTTSFGLGASFYDAGIQEMVHIPVAFPYRTGIMRAAAAAAPANADPGAAFAGAAATNTAAAAAAVADPNDQIVSFLPHCSAVLSICGPVLRKAKLQSNQGVEGYWGWFAVNEPDRPWHNADAEPWDDAGSAASATAGGNYGGGCGGSGSGGKGSPGPVVTHVDSPPLTMSQAAEMAQVANVASVVANLVSTRGKFPVGVSLHIGICVDSTAVVEYALLGKTSIFPVILSGPFRQALIEASFELQSFYPADSPIKSALKAVRRAYVNLPNDTYVAPAQLADACTRVLNSLPEGVPYAVAAECRRDVAAVLKRLSASGCYRDDIVVGV